MATTPTDYKFIRNNAVTKTANYTATIDDGIIFANAAGGAFTVTLYTAVGNAGREITVIRTNTGLPVTIDGNGAETINGAASIQLNIQWDSRTMVSDGSNWIIK